jgi:hypothetical protein
LDEAILFFMENFTVLRKGVEMKYGFVFEEKGCISDNENE